MARRGFVSVPAPLGGPARFVAGPCPQLFALLHTGRAVCPRALAEPPRAAGAAGAAVALDGDSPSRVLHAGALPDSAQDRTHASSRRVANSVMRVNGTRSPRDGSGRFRVGQPHTEESRRKIGEANKGKVPWNKGRKHSPETKRRIAEATRRAMSRPETRNKLKEKATGRRHSEATKSKIALASRSRFGTATSADPPRRTLEDIISSFALQNRREKRNPVPFSFSPEMLEKMNAQIHQLASGRQLRPVVSRREFDPSAEAFSRRPMSDSTKAKLSARIKEKWTDPEYRERVRSGLKRSLSGKHVVRRSLSESHKERIRQSLLERNAHLREIGVLPPKAVGRRKSSKRRTGMSSDDALSVNGVLHASHLSGLDTAEHSDDADGSVVADARSAARERRRRRQIARNAAKVKEQDRALLAVLASAGQLPPLTPGGERVSGDVSPVPLMYESDGPYGQSSTGPLSSLQDPEEGNGRLVFSSTGSGVIGQDMRDPPDTIAIDASNLVPLDFDIYNPPSASLEDALDDDVFDEDEEEEDYDDEELLLPRGSDVHDEDSDMNLSGGQLFSEDVDDVISEVLGPTTSRRSSPRIDTRDAPEDSIDVDDVGDNVMEGDVPSEEELDLDGLTIQAEELTLGGDEGRGFDVSVPSRRKGRRDSDGHKRVVTYVNGKPEYVD